MKPLWNFFGLTRDRQYLVAEALFFMVFSFAATRLLPYQWHQSLYGRVAAVPKDFRDVGVWQTPGLRAFLQECEPEASIEARRAAAVGWALSRVKKYWPGDETCLLRALAGRRMLLRRGLSARLYIGALRQPDTDVRLHAWLLQDELPVTGVKEAIGFSVLAVFE